jgi:hypothetical protein
VSARPFDFKIVDFHLLQYSDTLFNSQVLHHDKMGSWEAILKTGEYHDFTITCKGFTFRVHKLVLRAASDFFRTLCDGNFQVCDSQLKYHEFRLIVKFRKEQNLLLTFLMIILISSLEPCDTCTLNVDMSLLIISSIT